MIFTQRHINHYIILLIAEFSRKLEQGVQGGNVLHGAMLGLLSAGSGEGMMALGGSLKSGMKPVGDTNVNSVLSLIGHGIAAGTRLSILTHSLLRDIFLNVLTGLYMLRNSIPLTL